MKQLKDSTLIWLSTNSCNVKDRIKYGSLLLERINHCKHAFEDMTAKLSKAAIYVNSYVGHYEPLHRIIKNITEE